jgi:hypothetical protein
MDQEGRTMYQAQLDARYGRCFQELNERFYQHVDFIFGAITLLGGSAIVATVTADHKVLAAISTAVVAISAIVERLVGAVERRVQHREMKRRFAELDASASSLSLADFDAKLKSLQNDGPVNIGALALPAYNANLLAEGHSDHVLSLSKWQRLMEMLA